MAYSTPVLVVASAARTTTGNSGTLAVPEAGGQLSILLNVTATSGTPNMVVSIQWSDDGGATWADADVADSFIAITAAKVTVKAFQVRAPMYRIVWTITGSTPSLTFTALSFVTT